VSATLCAIGRRSFRSGAPGGFRLRERAGETRLRYGSAGEASARREGLPVTSPAQWKPHEKRDFRQEVTDSIVRLLEEGVAPWRKPWEATGVPLNPTTGKSYRGGKAIHPMAAGIRRSFEDPRWMTYRQAAEQGWQVREGEKGAQLEFWENAPKQRGEDPACARRPPKTSPDPSTAYTRSSTQGRSGGSGVSQTARHASAPASKSFRPASEHRLRPSWGSCLGEKYPEVASSEPKVPVLVGRPEADTRVWSVVAVRPYIGNPFKMGSTVIDVDQQPARARSSSQSPFLCINACSGTQGTATPPRCKRANRAVTATGE